MIYACSDRGEPGRSVFGEGDAGPDASSPPPGMDGGVPEEDAAAPPGRCFHDEHCTDPARSSCDTDTGRCRPCVVHEECEHLGGRCVDGACTSERADVCSPCASDVDCADGLGCVAMTYRGVPRDDGYCLAEARSPCTGRPFTTLLRDRPTLSSSAPRNWCGVDEMRTSCEAVLDTLAAKPCASDGNCGAVGLTGDGLCRAGLCSHPCDAHVDCPAGSDCIDDTSGGGTGTGSGPGGPAGVDFCR